MEVYYIEAGIFEEMLARADSLSAQVDRLYEKKQGKRNRESEWITRMSACALTSLHVPCRLSGIPDGWHSPKSNGKSTTGQRTWKS